MVVLPKWMAIEVIKDLDRLDLADSSIILLNLEIDGYVRQLGLQDRIILGHQEQIRNLNEIIVNRLDAIDIKEKEIAHWKKQYKKQKRQKFLVGGIGLGLVVLAVIAN